MTANPPGRRLARPAGGDSPADGDTWPSEAAVIRIDAATAAVSFAATAPTAGRYLLYLDFKVDDTVHTASFVVDAAPGGGNQTAPETPRDAGHAGGH